MIIDDTTYELASRELVAELRRHYTDASVDRLVADAESGRKPWREIYDTIAGALCAKERPMFEVVGEITAAGVIVNGEVTEVKIIKNT